MNKITAFAKKNVWATIVVVAIVVAGGFSNLIGRGKQIASDPKSALKV